MTNLKATVTLEEDPDTGDLIMPIPDDIWNETGWQIGDTVEWIDNHDGTWSLKKKE